MKFWFPCFLAQSVSDDRSKQGATPPNFRVFSYKELKVATSDFRPSNKVGEGSFGSVYKGYLQDGAVVAVKVLSVELESLQGERQFISEIAALSDIKHENLVSLRGCCIYGAKRLLVYEYMENNSLAVAFLGKTVGVEGRRQMNWEMRRYIISGVARGLAFLHEEAEPHIVHRDIKPANILLDSDFTPKIADFGLSKLFTSNASYVSTRVAGTLGYLAPEYAVTGHLTRKSDVYSFGVLLLQIVSKHSIVEFNMEQGDIYLVEKVWNLYKTDNLLSLVDPALNREFVNEEVLQFMKVGLLCVQETVSLRPQMSAVVKMLANKLDIGEPSIAKPGCLPDLKLLKVNYKHSSDSESSNSSTFLST